MRSSTNEGPSLAEGTYLDRNGQSVQGANCLVIYFEVVIEFLGSLNALPKEEIRETSSQLVRNSGTLPERGDRLDSSQLARRNSCQEFHKSRGSR